MFGSRSLKHSLIWRFLVAAIIPLLVVGLLSLGYIADHTKKIVDSENLLLAKTVAGEIHNELLRPFIVLEQIPSIVHSHGDTNEFDTAHVLTHSLGSYSGFDAIYQLDLQGKVTNVGLPHDVGDQREELIGIDFSAQPFFQNVKKTNQATWSDVFLSLGSGKHSVHLAIPADNSYIAASFSIEKIRAITDTFRNQEDQTISVVDQKGTLIFASHEKGSMQGMNIRNLVPIRAGLGGTTGTFYYQVKKETLIGSVASVPSVNWIVLVSQPKKTAYAAIYRLWNLIGGGVIVGVLIAGFFSLALSTRITRPIARLAEAAASISGGRYDFPVPEQRHEEIEELASSFRKMSKSISEREALLWESREHYSRLFNGISDAVFLAEQLPDGTPGNFLEVNQVACELLGYNRDEFNQMTPMDIDQLHTEDPDAALVILENLKESGHALFKTSLAGKEGQTIPAEVSSQVFDIDGDPVYFSVARDISEREKFESSIQTLVRSTVGLTGQSCLDEITRNLCSWLQADMAMVGMEEGDRIQTISCFYDGEFIEQFDFPVAGTPCEQVAAEGICLIPEKVCDQFPEATNLHRIGAEGYIGVPLIGSNGDRIGLVNVLSKKPLQSMPQAEQLMAVIASRAAAEIERMNFEDELGRSEELFRTLLASTAEAIVGFDLNGKCTFCNSSTLSILGYGEEQDLLGKTFNELIRPKGSYDSKVDSKAFAAIRRGEGLAVNDEVFIRGDGSYIPVEYWAHPMWLDGKIIGGVVTFLDISERRTLEAQLQHAQKMEALGTLTGGIAHDFNNILTAITGYTGLLQMKIAEDDPLRKKVDQIFNAAGRGAKLTHGLLTYSRKNTGDPRPVNLNTIVENVHSVFGQIIGEKVIQKADLDSNELIVKADSNQIEQVLVNLATNARDSMPEGGLLSIATRVVTLNEEFSRQHGYGTPGKYALLTVSDSGEGIPEDLQHRIFDPFFTTKDVGKGTGLGLSIVYGIIKEHNGYINVTSTMNKGSEFQIYLPLFSGSAGVEIVESESALPGGTETIMLVEDDEQVRESTEAMLQEVGYKVISCVDAEDALNKFKRQAEQINLILTDVVMPGMNGGELYHEVQKFSPGMPVVFISGYTFDTLRNQGLVGKGVHLLSKPVMPISLLTRLRAILDKNN